MRGNLKLIPVDLKRANLQEALKEATVNAQAQEKQYLCKKGSSLFVATVSLGDFNDLPRNCSKGCLYVDWEKHGEIVPIDQLTELYYIEGGDYL